MLEKQIEDAVCRYAREFGMLAYKFNSMSRASVPDRMFVAPHGQIIFIEFKRNGAKPTPQQLRELTRLRDMNVPAFVVDNTHEGRWIIHLMKLKCDMMVLSDDMWSKWSC